MGHEFDEDIALEPLAAPGAEAGRHCFGAAISHRWDTVGPPNGGFLLALAARGLTAAAPLPDPVTLTGHFPPPSRHPPVEIPVTPTRTGPTPATPTGRLHQGRTEPVR